MKFKPFGIGFNPFGILKAPFGMVRKVITWTSAGLIDKFTTRLSGKKMTFGQRIAAKIDQCEPWSDHLEISAIKGINKALSSKEFEAARAFVALGSKEDAVRECIELLKLGIEILASGEEIQFELFYCLE